MFIHQVQFLGANRAQKPVNALLKFGTQTPNTTLPSFAELRKMDQDHWHCFLVGKREMVAAHSFSSVDPQDINESIIGGRYGDCGAPHNVPPLWAKADRGIQFKIDDCEFTVLSRDAKVDRVPGRDIMYFDGDGPRDTRWCLVQVTNSKGERIRERSYLNKQDLEALAARIPSN
jgi:hypothetical protein